MYWALIMICLPLLCHLWRQICRQPTLRWALIVGLCTDLQGTYAQAASATQTPEIVTAGLVSVYTSTLLPNLDTQIWFADPRHFLDIQNMLFATGIEHQPGPPWTFGTLFPKVVSAWSGACGNVGQTFHLQVGNITCLSTHLDQIGKISADTLVFQEHSCPPSSWATATKYLRRNRRNTILSILDPESKHNLGGVGITSIHSRKVVKVKPRSDSFKRAVTTGRVEHYAQDIGCSTTLSIFSIYGWTGGHQVRKQACRTDAIIAAIHDEVQRQPTGPVIIAGDLNGETKDFRTLQDMLDHESWTDIGEQAQLWGQPKSQPTCLAPNTTIPTSPLEAPFPTAAGPLKKLVHDDAFAIVSSLAHTIIIDRTCASSDTTTSRMISHGDI